jgi:hypothetical protein
MQSRNFFSFPTVKNNLDNMLDDFTNDQFIESLLWFHNYTLTIPVNQESVDLDTSIDDTMHFDGF